LLLLLIFNIYDPYSQNVNRRKSVEGFARESKIVRGAELRA